MSIFLGAIGCRFFSKRKIPKETPNELNVIFKLYVGVELTIDSFQFVFIDVEDRTLKFMMDHPKEVRTYGCITSYHSQIQELFKYLYL